MPRAFNIGAATVPAGAYMPVAAFQIPIKSGLVGAFLLGAGANYAPRNWAPVGVDAQIVGSPSFAAGRASFSDGNYLQTAIPETTEQTIVAVARRPSVSDSAGFLGTYTGGLTAGVSLFASPDQDFVKSTSTRDAGNGNIGASGSITGYSLFALTVPAAGQSRIENLTAGTLGLSPAGNREVTGGIPYRIGTIPGLTGPNQQLCVLIYNRALVSAELSQAATWARSYAASLGITV